MRVIFFFIWEDEGDDRILETAEKEAAYKEITTRRKGAEVSKAGNEKGSIVVPKEEEAGREESQEGI